MRKVLLLLVLMGLPLNVCAVRKGALALAGSVGGQIGEGEYLQRAYYSGEPCQGGGVVDMQLSNPANVLHAAVLGGCLQDVIGLIDSGRVSVDAGDRTTPLHTALFNGEEKIAWALLDRGADIGALGGLYNDTVLGLASQQGFADFADELLCAGANPYKAGGYLGRRPLHWACTAESGGVDVVRLLLRSGADPNAVDDSDETPLHLAARLGKTRIVKVLRRHGAIEKENEHGRTPTDIANDSDDHLTKRALKMQLKRRGCQGSKEQQPK